MEISYSGIQFIKKEEGEKLTAYRDSRNIMTIGVGHTGLVRGQKIVPGMTITAEESSSLLVKDLAWVESTLNKEVKAELTQNQYDALCSLVFNIGTQAFIGSSVLQKLNAGDHHSAAEAMLLWKKAGRKPNILLPRRIREKQLFLS
ncbi:lysozyme [Kalamiella sp. sgz302252]|uniref:lysozyme n=1 Tax=Pantoea sp. sgz302252 TaxID=3341827 RepID=UPI0036D26078